MKNWLYWENSSMVGNFGGVGFPAGFLWAQK